MGRTQTAEGGMIGNMVLDSERLETGKRRLSKDEMSTLR